MILDGTQMRAVNHGIVEADGGFRFVDLPVGPQPLPAWARGLHIDWLMRYNGNSPDIRLKVRGDAREWPGKKFRKEGARYMATHPDGRAEVYYHDGKISPANIGRWRYRDGRLLGFGEYPTLDYKTDDPGTWEDHPVLATTQQNGFGGAKIPVEIEGGEYDGQLVILRGPWHGCSPPGYEDVAYVDVDRPDEWRRRRGEPWHRSIATAGLYITHDLFLRLVARFAPHVRVALNRVNGVDSIEVVKAEWDCPKYQWLQKHPEDREPWSWP